MTLGAARAIEIAAAICRQKVLAVALGPAGVGVLGWIRNVCDLFTIFPQLGLDGAATRFIAGCARDGRRDEVRAVVATALGAALLNVPVALLIYLFVAPRHIATGLENGGAYLPHLYVALVSVPLCAAVSTLNACLIGFKEVGRASRLIVASSLVTLLVITPMIFLFHLWGAVAGLVVIAAINAALYGRECSRVFPLSLRGASLAVARKMSGVAAANWIGASLSLLAFLIVRSILARDYSNDVAGLFQSVLVLGTQYFAPLTNSLAYYTYPRMSELREPADISREINATMRLLLLLCTPAIVAMGTVVEPLLLILFSARFVAAAPMLAWQILGEWIRVPMRSMGLAVLGQGRSKPYILFDSLAYVVLIAVTAACGGMFEVTRNGHLMTLAPNIGYACGALASAGGFYWVTRREFGFRLSRENRILIAASLPVLALALFVSPGGAWACAAAGAKIAALAVWAVSVTRRDEWRRLLSLIRR